MPPVQHLVKLVRLDGQRPEDVARVVLLFMEILRRMPVEDRTAERDMFGAMPITPQREVPPRDHELEFFRPGMPEDGDALGMTSSYSRKNMSRCGLASFDLEHGGE